MLCKIIFQILIYSSSIWANQSVKKCTKWTERFIDLDGPSMVYSESPSPNDGIGTQLSIFAMLWMLRRSYNVDVFISSSCRDTLAKVFTEESLNQIQVLDEYFCNPEDITFEYFLGKFEFISKNKEFRVGRTLWLWPRTELASAELKSKGKELSGGDYDSKFRYYK